MLAVAVYKTEDFFSCTAENVNPFAKSPGVLVVAALPFPKLPQYNILGGIIIPERLIRIRFSPPDNVL